jgi:hypothetical protein
MSQGSAVVCEKVFIDAMAFLKPHLRGQPVSPDESLIKRVPVAGDRADKRDREAESRLVTGL